MKEYKNCPDFLQSYLRYLELVEGKAPATVDGRCKDVRGFLQFLRRRCEDYPTPQEQAVEDTLVYDMPVETVAAVTADDIEEYLEYLCQTRRVSQHTIYFRRAPSLRDFYNWLLQQQVDLGVTILSNPVPHYDTAGAQGAPAAPNRILSPSEIDRVLKAVTGDNAVRDIAIILLISTTGLAADDVVRIRYRDWHGDHLLIDGRKVYLTEATQRAIRAYLAEYRDPIEQYLIDNTLFVSRRNRKRLAQRSIQKMLQKHFDAAGVEGSARDLRHTAVMELLKNARNECERSYLAGYLGYTNPASLNRLGLPKTEDSDTVPQLLGNSWLNNIGKRG